MVLNRPQQLSGSMSQLGQTRRFGHRPVTSGLPRSTDILGAGWHVSNVPAAEIATGYSASPPSLLQGAVHLVRPAWIVSLERRQDIVRSSCYAIHLLRAASRFVPLSKRAVTADENFQTGPPIWPNLQGARGSFKCRFRASGKKARQCKHVKPDEILRIVGAQPQAIFKRRNRLRCTSTEKKCHSEDQMAQCKERTDLNGLSGSTD